MSDEQTHKLILHIELPTIFADDMTPEWCAAADPDGGITPEDVFADAYDEKVVVALLVHVGEDPDEVMGVQGKVVGFDVVPR